MSGATKSTTSATPWKIQEPFLETGFEKAGEILKKGPADYYGGKTQAKFAGPESWAHRRISDFARGQTMRNMQDKQRSQLNQSYARAGGMDTLADAAQKHGLGVATKVGEYGQGAMDYGAGQMKTGLTQDQYSGITPFQSAQLKDMLAGKVNVGQLNPVLAARKRDIMSQLEGPSGMLAQIRQKTLGFQPGGGSRGDIVTGMAAKEATRRLMDESKGMYADAFAKAQERRLPAGQMALQAQLAAQQLGMQGAETRLGAGRMGQQAYGTALGARTAAGQQGLSALDRARGVMMTPIETAKEAERIGAKQRAYRQETMNQKMAKYNYGANAEQQALQNYMSMISGQYGGSGSYKPSPLSSMGSLASLFAGFQSDINVKENIVPEEAHWKGFNVYSFNYIGDSKPRRGVMAQEVELSRPDAVYEVDGVKHVAYGLL